MQTLIEVLKNGTWSDRLKIAWLFLLLIGGWAILGAVRWWVEG